LLGSTSISRIWVRSRSATDIAKENGRRELFLLVLAAVFVFTNGVALNLALDGRFYWWRLSAPLAWLGLTGGVYLLLRIFRPFHDPYLLPIVGLLTGWGFILLGRLAPNFLGRQVLWLAIGMAVMAAVAIWPRNLRFLRRYRYTWLIIGIFLLAATLFLGVNPSGGGAALWLQVPFLGRVFFQPSELLKLLLVVFLASYVEDRESLLVLNRGRGRFGPLPYLAPLLLMWGFCVVLLVWQQDLGAATLFFIVFLALLYLAAGDKRYLLGGLALLIVAGVLGYFAFDVVALRIDTWLNPWPEADTRGYQIVQSLYAIASGGFLGQGVAQGYPNYIPVVHSDFAFAAVAEEWGLVGALGLVACFALLAYRGLWIAIHSKRPFRLYLAAGVTITMTAQALLIMGGVTKLLPLTGVTLPFVSYGGSSLLISCMMVGLLLYLSDYRSK
jgi:peptidoglycan glycosyltransferase